MRLVFLGNDPWSVPSLEVLAADPAFDLAAVITNPPRPAGRGSRLTPTAVAEAARGLVLTVLEVEGVRQGAGFAAIRDAAPDVIVVVAYGELLPPEVLALPRLGAVNVHFSLLPRWRGASPVQHALLSGDQRTGVTLMQMDSGLDTGPLLATAADEIRPSDDAGSLGARLAAAGARLLPPTLTAYASGALKAGPQPEDGVTLAPKLGPADRLVSWGAPAHAIVGRIRALSPDPGARTTFRGGSLKLLRGEAVEPSGIPSIDADRDWEEREPGTVVSMDDQGPLIATGAGSVRLGLVAPAGRKHMTGADWARGARIRSGERLG